MHFPIFPNNFGIVRIDPSIFDLPTLQCPSKRTEMTQEAIQLQIEALERAGAELAKSPEASRQFLINIGLLKEKSPKRKKQAKHRTN